MKGIFHYISPLKGRLTRLPKRRDRKKQANPPNEMGKLRSQLLQLPSEIRRHIYQAVVDIPVVDHISLLCVCKQINEECSEFFFQRPLVCQSQTKLIEFTQQNPSVFLENITFLQIRLEELDPAVMQPFLAARVMGLGLHAHPYYLESQRIVASLRKLSNLRQLIVLPPNDRTRSVSSQGVLGYVLTWAQKNYPKLENLTLLIDTVSLSCLSGFKNLKSLHFSGFSLTSSEISLELFRELKSLRELTVAGPSDGLRWRQSLGYDHKVVKSITPDVIRNMNSLRSFTLCELEDPKIEESALMSKGLVRALYESHRDSLSELNLSCVATPDAEMQEFIGAFLMTTTRVAQLSFGWPDLDVAFLDCLPATTQRLEVAVMSAPHAQALMDRLMMIEYRLTRLRWVGLMLVNPVQQAVPEGGKEEVRFAFPMQGVGVTNRLMRVPWAISWGVWQVGRDG